MTGDLNNEATQRALFEALGRNGRDPAALLSLLGRSGITAEQMNMIEMLLALEQQSDDEPEPAVVRRRQRSRSRDPRFDGAGRPTRERVLRELADLREVNDTLAAALGACRVCWGGDPRCVVCRGAGRSGAAEPDLELFKRLVAPAVRRVCALTRARSADSIRVSADGPPMTEVIA